MSRTKKLIFSTCSKEQQHLDSINQLLNGIVPNINQQSGGQQNSSNQQLVNQQFINQSHINFGTNTYNEHDKMLCNDSLSTEKFISSTYNTAIFEFRDKNVRQVLNHIQKNKSMEKKFIITWLVMVCIKFNNIKYSYKRSLFKYILDKDLLYDHFYKCTWISL